MFHDSYEIVLDIYKEEDKKPKNYETFIGNMKLKIPFVIKKGMTNKKSQYPPNIYAERIIRISDVVHVKMNPQ